MKIFIEECQPGWASDFLEEKAAIGSTLIDFVPVIEHVGSTSVAGLCAKPTIDILVGVPAESQLDETISPMIDRGYTYFRKYEAALPYRRLFARLKALTGKIPPEVVGIHDEFVRGREFVSLANIHVVVKDTPHWARHLAFRDYLRAHPDLRDEYGRLKKELAEHEFQDTNDYNRAKERFIQTTQLQAVAWYNNRNSV